MREILKGILPAIGTGLFVYGVGMVGVIAYDKFFSVSYTHLAVSAGGAGVWVSVSGVCLGVQCVQAVGQVAFSRHS